MSRGYVFHTTITCEHCGNPDWEVEVMVTYTSGWTVENIQATVSEIGPNGRYIPIELSVAQGDRLVTQAAEHWEDAKASYESGLADWKYEMQKDELLHP